MKWIGIIASAILIIMGGWMMFSAPMNYYGKETFYTELEYTKFKEVVSNPKINIDTIQSLSSSPPIVVQFSVDVPRNVEFDYGNKNIASAFVSGVVVLIIGIMFGVVTYCM